MASILIKLVNEEQTTSLLLNSAISLGTWTHWLYYGIILIETATVAGLLFRRSRATAALCASFFFACGASYAMWRIATGETPPCGCFGALALPNGSLLGLNLVMFGVSASMYARLKPLSPAFECPRFLAPAALSFTLLLAGSLAFADIIAEGCTSGGDCVKGFGCKLIASSGSHSCPAGGGSVQYAANRYHKNVPKIRYVCDGTVPGCANNGFAICYTYTISANSDCSDPDTTLNCGSLNHCNP